MARRVFRTCGMVGLLAVVSSVLVVGGTPAWADDGPVRTRATAESVSYTTPGTHTYVVPAGVSSLELKAVGASGGSTCVAGGAGTEVAGRVPVEAGDKITVKVGAAGQTLPDARGAGGGGATEIFLNRFVNNEDIARIIVAGGGGGAGACVTAKGGVGGSAADGAKAPDYKYADYDSNTYAMRLGGAGGKLGSAASVTGAPATDGGGGGGGHQGGGAGRPGVQSDRTAGGAGGGGGGAGTSWTSPYVGSGRVALGTVVGDGGVSITPSEGDTEAKTQDRILPGDPTSELAHAVRATSGSGVGTEAGVLRRYTGQGDPMKTDNFRYATGVLPTGQVQVSIEETYPGGSSVKREYEVYVNNQLVHHRSASSNSAEVKSYSFTLDGSRFAADQPMKVMVKNASTRTDASIHSITVTTH